MSSPEQRRSERIRVSIPIMVAGLDPSGAEFSEETRTAVVNREGALILLKHSLARENYIRIINLQNDAAADFRIVGPTCRAADEGTEWGVEYLKAGMEIWGVDFPFHPEEKQGQASALLECQACHKKYFWPLTLMEIEVLESTGIIENFCNACGKSTSWVYADASRRPTLVISSTGATSIPQTQPGIERRENKRLLLKLPILVRNQKGEAEEGRTENLSHANLAVALALDLAVGEFVNVICPLTTSGKNLERSARVMRKDKFSTKDRKLYGMQYAMPPALVT
jgi:hypothetical protein